MTFISDSESSDYRDIIVALLVGFEHLDRKLDLVNQRCEELSKQVKQVVNINQKLSWAACPFDAEGKSCEDYLQESE
ncbi:MAG: hypothetical protein HWQ38_15365 [Nostoc sp. NMS7]|uniref:hypothetical protein n=1 Tax=Nostoc sp. NMS7 TaxID=2815391 RepID=UPI0025E14FF8|nr:hypothetical protein [Nostoc sp. NMS7]MBN3947754.1 hypothetical protein [Nostoc sp. NMS7]